MEIWEKAIDQRVKSKTFVKRNLFEFIPGRSKM